MQEVWQVCERIPWTANNNFFNSTRLNFKNSLRGIFKKAMENLPENSGIWLTSNNQKFWLVNINNVAWLITRYQLLILFKISSYFLTGSGTIPRGASVMSSRRGIFFYVAHALPLFKFFITYLRNAISHVMWKHVLYEIGNVIL